MRFLAVSCLLALLTPVCSGQQAESQSHTRPYTNLYDMLNYEAKADDTAGIHQYSEDLIGIVVPYEAGKKYRDSLTNRLAKAEQLAREGKGKLVPEQNVVTAFNDLMGMIGAPPSIRASDATIQKFRAHSIDVPVLSTLISVDKNGTNCYPGEAVALLYVLISNNGSIPDDLLENVQTLKHLRKQQNTMSGNSVTSTLAGSEAYLLLSSYSERHHGQAVGLFNLAAQILNF